MGDLPRSLKIATVWLLVGLLVFLGVQTLLAERQRSLFTAGPEAIEIRRGPDGHYHWPGRLGDLEVDFLVDTGATSTALPPMLQSAVMRSAPDDPDAASGRYVATFQVGIVAGARRAAPVRKRVGEPVEIEIDDGRREQRQRLADDQAADHQADAEQRSHRDAGQHAVRHSFSEENIAAQQHPASDQRAQARGKHTGDERMPDHVGLEGLDQPVGHAVNF